MRRVAVSVALVLCVGCSDEASPQGVVDIGADAPAADAAAEVTPADSTLDTAATEVSIDSADAGAEVDGPEADVESEAFDSAPTETAPDSASSDTFLADTAVADSASVETAASDSAVETAATDTAVTDGADAGDAGPGIGTCASPLVVSPSGPFVSVVDTTPLGDFTAPTCGTSSGRDVVAKLTLTETRNVRVSASTDGTPPTVSIRTTCGDDGSAAVCGTGSLVQKELGAGTYYVVVDTELTGATGAFLSIAADPPLAPIGCTSPPVLTLSSPTTTVSGDTTSVKDNAVSSCSATYMPDDVYAFDLATAKTVTLKASATKTGFVPVVFLRSTCADPKTELEHGCAAATGTGTSATITRTLAAGRYYAFVESSGARGSYDLQITTADPIAGEACAVAVPITFVGGTATLTGTTDGAVPDHNVCARSDVRDRVYSMTLSKPQRVTFSASGYYPYVSLRKTCADAGTQITCSYASPKVIGELPAGTYGLLLGRQISFSGPYGVAITLADPKPGESCLDTLPISFGSTISNAITGFGDDVGDDGPDAVYTFTETTSGTRKLTTTVAATTTTTFFDVYEGSCAPGPGQVRVLNYQDSGLAKPLSGTFPTTAGKQYWIVINTNKDAGSTVTVRVD